MFHSSGKESMASIYRIGKNASGIHVVLLRASSLDTQQIESMIGSGMIQWEKM